MNSEATPPGLNVTNVTKTYGATTALDDVSLVLAPGEIVALLGPSGCGKSTLLMIVAGLEPPDSGKVFWEGRSLVDVPPHRRGFGMMFQDFALFPHKNVFENVAFGLKMGGRDPTSIRERVGQTLALVGLPGFETRDVNTLSGGEAQRVALARALAHEPSLLMLDEPLGSVDRTLRERLVVDLRRILRLGRQTALYVTHDQEEAFVIADRVMLMNEGRIVQSGTPQELYLHPNSVFTARFLGLNNLIAGEVRVEAGGPQVVSALGSFPVTTPARGPVTMLLRPDAVQLDSTLPCQINGVVHDVSFRGGSLQVEIEADEVSLFFEFPAYAELPPTGTSIRLGFYPQEAIQVFSR